LLCNSSTYFKAALNNGFSETLTQKITLDDEDPDVFRTYAVWLFQLEITDDSLSEVDNLIRHLFQVYIFADKRDIRSLANDVVTFLSSFWVSERIHLCASEYLPLIPPQCTLYELVLDTLILDLRVESWDAEDWKTFGSHPQWIIVELFKRDQDFPDSFKNLSDCFKSICHYHEHEDADEKRVCVRRVESGRNLYADHEGPWDHVEWRW
jgi:hypothetical protein